MTKMKFTLLFIASIQFIHLQASPDPATIEILNYDGPIVLQSTPNFPSIHDHPQKPPFQYNYNNQDCDCVCKHVLDYMPLNTVSQARCPVNYLNKGHNYPQYNPQIGLSNKPFYPENALVPQTVSFSKILDTGDVVSMTYDMKHNVCGDHRK